MLLDEVGDIPADLQVKLLRVIEHRAVTPVGDARPRPTDIRIIAATNRPLDELMATGQFREDLFFRLSVFPIHIPPLRDRREDIPALAEHFLRQSRLADIADARLSDELLDELRSRPWVGNIRELRNAIEHAAIVARGRAIRREHLPAATVRADETPAPAGSQLQGWLAEWTRREVQTPAHPTRRRLALRAAPRAGRAAGPQGRPGTVPAQPRRGGRDAGHSPGHPPAEAAEIRHRVERLGLNPSEYERTSPAIGRENRILKKTISSTANLRAPAGRIMLRSKSRYYDFQKHNTSEARDQTFTWRRVPCDIAEGLH